MTISEKAKKNRQSSCELNAAFAIVLHVQASKADDKQTSRKAVSETKAKQARNSEADERRKDV